MDLDAHYVLGVFFKRNQSPFQGWNFKSGGPGARSIGGPVGWGHEPWKNSFKINHYIYIIAHITTTLFECIRIKYVISYYNIQGVK